MNSKNFIVFFVTVLCYGIGHSSELDSNVKIEYLTSKQSSTSTSVTASNSTPSIFTSTKVPETTTNAINSTTSTSTTTKVPETTTNATNFTTPTSTTTKVPDVISTTSRPTTTEKGEHGHDTNKNNERHFDCPSFIGGIVSTLGLSAIGFVAYKYFRPGSRGEPYKYL